LSRFNHSGQEFTGRSKSNSKHRGEVSKNSSCGIRLSSPCRRDTKRWQERLVQWWVKRYFFWNSTHYFSYRRPQTGAWVTVSGYVRALGQNSRRAKVSRYEYSPGFRSWSRSWTVNRLCTCTKAIDCPVANYSERNRSAIVIWWRHLLIGSKAWIINPTVGTETSPKVHGPDSRSQKLPQSLKLHRNPLVIF